MDGNLSPDHVSRSADAVDRGPSLPWMVIGGAGGALALLVLLARYAIDLLAPLSVLVLATHSVRDTFLDWFSGESYAGEPDPAWAVGAVVTSLAGTAVGVVWLFSTSPWAIKTAAHSWLPPGIVRAASAAEAYGWGQRAVLPGGPVKSADVSPAPAEAQDERGDSRGDAGSDAAAAALVGRPARTADDSRTSAPLRATTGAVSPTSTRISSSASLVRVGSRVAIDARVLSSAGRPSGTVVFREGSVVIGSAGVDEDGHATLSIENRRAGSRAITAEFMPSAAFLGSRSGTQILIVVP
jgi:hypothetical protein